VPNNLAHFDIPADDVERARRFYEAVFQWRFSSFGPPDFYLIQTGTDEQPGIGGSVSLRHEPLAPGGGLGAFECTISVDDLGATVAAVTANGGTTTMPPYTLTGVGQMAKFHDTEGNAVVVMKYDRPH